MTQKSIHVGVVGAHTTAGWAKLSHIPAINNLPALKLAAVATRNEQSARPAAVAFGAYRWVSDPLALISDDGIDVVTTSRKGPDTPEMVFPALRSAKTGTRTP